MIETDGLLPDPGVQLLSIDEAKLNLERVRIFRDDGLIIGEIAPRNFKKAFFPVPI